MKTKIKTISVYFALVVIGLTNINAMIDEKKSTNNELISSQTELMNLQTVMAEEAFINSEEALIAAETDEQIEKYASMQINLAEIADAKSDFKTTTELITAEESDVEIEKYAEKLISLYLTRAKRLEAKK